MTLLWRGHDYKLFRRFTQAVTCANGQCGRPLDTQINQGYPDSTVPPSYIHKLYDPPLSPFQVVCTKCGHYSLRYQRNRPD